MSKVLKTNKLLEPIKLASKQVNSEVKFEPTKNIIVENTNDVIVATLAYNHDNVTKQQVSTG